MLKPVAVMAFSGAMLLAGCAPHIADQVTSDGLLALKKGMSYEDVESLIGPPLCVTRNDETHCFTNTTPISQELHTADISLMYTEPSAPWTNPEVDVSLHHGQVGSIYVKYQDFGICCMKGLPKSPFYWIGSRDLLFELIGK